MEFKTWVEVDRERLETLRVLELPDVFTTDSGAGRIRGVSQSIINASNLQAWNKVQPTIAILPTSRPMISCHTNVYVVPYSDHSSYLELEDFVSALRPISLVPIVGNCLPYFSSLLNPCRKKPKEVVIPESVKHYMMTNSNIQSSTNGIANMFQRTLQPESRGVVFESPVSKIRRLSHDDGDSETDQDSDSILLDLSTNSYSRENGPHNKRLKPIQVASENVVTIGRSLPSDDNESVSTLTSNVRSPDHSSVYECEHESPTKSSKEKSPQMGRTNSRERSSSLVSISIHDQTCITAAFTPPDTRSVTAALTFTLQREQIEQFLLENFIISAEQLKGEQMLWGVHEEIRLTPVDLPKPAGDPLEAAIKTLKSKCD